MSNFNADYALYYDSLYGEKEYVKECDVLEQAFKSFGSEPPIHLLDLGCGTGRHALIMSKRGYKIIGVDSSQMMLNIARDAEARVDSHLDIEWLCGDLRTFSIPKTFDAAYMMFAVIGYLNSNSDILVALKNIRRHLKVGAILLFDFWFGPAIASTGIRNDAREVDTGEGKIIRLSNKFHNQRKQQVTVTFKIWRLQERIVSDYCEETHVVRYFNPQEVELLLGMAAFELAEFSSFPRLDGSLSNDNWSALAVARAR